MITLTNVTKKFGDKIAVNNFSLTVEKGEFFIILGPNGAGKTTTIKLIAGLLKPTSGKITVCNHNVVEDHLNAKKHIAYIPEEPFIYPKLTGREFLEFTGKLYRLSDNRTKDEMDKYIEIFNMSSYIDNLSETYSHGMKQRVVISSALMHNPDVILVDEPLIGLDPESSKIVKNLLVERTKNGSAVFMSTHLLSLVEELAAKVSIMNEGKIVYIGSIKELTEKIYREAKQLTTTSLEDFYLKIIKNNKNFQE